MLNWHGWLYCIFAPMPCNSKHSDFRFTFWWFNPKASSICKFRNRIPRPIKLFELESHSVGDPIRRRWDHPWRRRLSWEWQNTTFTTAGCQNEKIDTRLLLYMTILLGHQNVPLIMHTERKGKGKQYFLYHDVKDKKMEAFAHFCCEEQRSITIGWCHL